MLVIRGSKSTMDWAINFDEAVTDFQYHLSPTQYVQGHVHRGIHQVDTFLVTYLHQRILKYGHHLFFTSKNRVHWEFLMDTT